MYIEVCYLQAQTNKPKISCHLHGHTIKITKPNQVLHKNGPEYCLQTL